VHSVTSASLRTGTAGTERRENMDADNNHMSILHLGYNNPL